MQSFTDQGFSHLTAPASSGVMESSTRSSATRLISDHFLFLDLPFPVSYPPFRASVKLDLRCYEWQSLHMFALSLLPGDILFFILSLLPSLEGSPF